MEPGCCVPTGRESAARKPNRARKKSQPVIAVGARMSCRALSRRTRRHPVERNAIAIARTARLRDKHGSISARRPRSATFPAGAFHDLRSHQGDRPRHRRGADRVHPGLVHRPSAAGAALLRLRRRGFRQDLRDPDPVRRHPRAAVDLFRAAVAARDRIFHRSGGAALRHRRPAGVPAGGGGRRAGARLHQGACCSTTG